MTITGAITADYRRLTNLERLGDRLLGVAPYWPAHEPLPRVGIIVATYSNTAGHDARLYDEDTADLNHPHRVGTWLVNLDTGQAWIIGAEISDNYSR